jgi:hypothetical protein
MRIELQVRVSEGDIVASVPGVWEEHFGNALVIEPARGRGRPTVHAVGRTIAAMATADIGVDPRHLLEVVPFGSEHLDVTAAMALLQYLAWRAWSRIHPGIAGWVTPDTISYRLWLPSWPHLPRAEREGFLRGMMSVALLGELVINNAPLLRQTVLRRLLRLQPVVVTGM